MNDDQITALAREYAEEKCGKENASPMYFSREKNEMEEKLRWLSRRYCLVEKGKLKDEYHEAKFTCGNVDPCSETFATSLAQKSVLECLFPEIAKEVEG